jgi:FkbM family methyltransferase
VSELTAGRTPGFISRAVELVRFARTVATLGPTTARRAEIVAKVLLLPFTSRAGVSPGCVTIETPGSHWRMRLADRSDFITFKEVIIDREYELDGPAPQGIVDLGAHAGTAVAFFVGEYGELPVLAVEPDPHTFARLHENLKDQPGVFLLRAAVGGKTGRGRIVKTDLSWGNRVESTDAGSSDSVEVLSLDDLLAKAELPRTGLLLKVDVEGAELDVLRETSSLWRFNAVVGELHLDPPERTLPGLAALLPGFKLETVQTSGRTVLFRATRDE